MRKIQNFAFILMLGLSSLHASDISDEFKAEFQRVRGYAWMDITHQERVQSMVDFVDGCPKPKFDEIKRLLPQEREFLRKYIRDMSDIWGLCQTTSASLTAELERIGFGVEVEREALAQAKLRTKALEAAEVRLDQTHETSLDERGEHLAQLKDKGEMDRQYTAAERASALVHQRAETFVLVGKGVAEMGESHARTAAIRQKTAIEYREKTRGGFGRIRDAVMGVDTPQQPGSTCDDFQKRVLLKADTSYEEIAGSLVPINPSSGRTARGIMAPPPRPYQSALSGSAAAAAAAPHAPGSSGGSSGSSGGPSSRSWIK